MIGIALISDARARSIDLIEKKFERYMANGKQVIISLSIDNEKNRADEKHLWRLSLPLFSISIKKTALFFVLFVGSWKCQLSAGDVQPHCGICNIQTQTATAIMFILCGITHIKQKFVHAHAYILHRPHMLNTAHSIVSYWELITFYSAHWTDVKS